MPFSANFLVICTYFELKKPCVLFKQILHLLEMEFWTTAVKILVMLAMGVRDPKGVASGSGGTEGDI